MQFLTSCYALHAIPKAVESAWVLSIACEVSQQLNRTSSLGPRQIRHVNVLSQQLLARLLYSRGTWPTQAEHKLNSRSKWHRTCTDSQDQYEEVELAEATDCICKPTARTQIARCALAYASQQEQCLASHTDPQQAGLLPTPLNAQATNFSDRVGLRSHAKHLPAAVFCTPRPCNLQGYKIRRKRLGQPSKLAVEHIPTTPRCVWSLRIACLRGHLLRRSS